ncbi:PdaC/SigV domain-containing protein [Novosphingobium sp. MMS21-SN21R]|uniref:DUF4163 domain-containing protein n=1 Tax=Novosphingobium sp. MMS21-SN21R TaxID=2969298 RepID=UPI00288872BC|nr:DUF4163 domain-containing protein [Novosphingobium sp. MMS21-SN21R]MDT0508782.1 DUF4163 domain-containing protein [Novosphingobium sp. MMS21-SN21R]
MRAIALIPLLVVAACSVSREPDASASASAEPSAMATPPVPPSLPVQTPVTARSVTEENDLYEFTYSYPAAAGAVPALKEWLDADLDKARAELVSDAKEGQADAKTNGYPFNPYSHSVEWQVVTDLPAWLSLSTLVGFYSGGAHPNYGYDTILWDRIAGKRRVPADLFTSKAALSAAIRDAFCKELDKQRARKREGQDLGGGVTEFDQCIDPAEQTVILGSSNGKAFDRIGVLVSPYAAGPYAEGSYEVTVPVTPKVLAAVKPEFKAAFVAR